MPVTAFILSILSWVICTLPASAAVYRCEQEGEPVLYSQFICPPRHQQESYDPTAANLIAIPPLSSEESAALATLEQNLRRSQLEASRAKARSRRQFAERTNRAQLLCEQAKTALAALRERKRQGYSAAEDRRFDAEKQRLQMQKKANC